MGIDEKFLFKSCQDFFPSKTVNEKCQKISVPNILPFWEPDLLSALVFVVLNSTEYIVLSVIKNLALFVLTP